MNQFRISAVTKLIRADGRLPVGEQAKILILEDDDLVAWSLREIGYEVTGIAATVNDALSMTQDRRPDLAIVDVRLPGKRDGIEGAELLWQRFGIPVIFLTGEIDQVTARRAADVEPSSYLMKPVRGEELIEAIRVAMLQDQPN